MTPLRSRRAPAAEVTSDVTRFRGVAFAAVLAAAVAIALVVAIGRDPHAGAPGPLSRPHQRAAIGCVSCHADTGAPPATACTTCHGAHPSARAGHRELAAAGKLGCPDCHAIHRTDGGVVLTASGRALRYGPGAETEVAAGGHYLPARDVTLPVVEAGQCARCHAIDTAADPIARCLIGGHESLGGRRPTVCFDEHPRRLADSLDAAGEAVREVVAAAPAAPRARSTSPSRGLLLGAAALAGVVGWTGVRVRRRQRRPARRDDAAASRSLVQVNKLGRLPVIDAATCLGCYACVDACPYDVLEVHQYIARVARPADCCGLTLCEQRCPNGSLIMADTGAPVTAAVPVDDALQAQAVPGIYLAGDVTGLPLIRNAINQGAHAVREIAATLARGRGPGELDLVIVGAGPAGISAALEAKAQKLRALTLEQATVASSINSFPRGKLVFDQPLDIPLVGALWLEEATKEELCARWMHIVRREQLAVRENRRVDRIERDGDGFAIASVDPEGEREVVRARRVVIAIGRRGSPRRLPVEVPSAMESHVHYSLADARSFAGQRVLVVGLGDAAMEAALALSAQPGTRVVVCHRGSDFSRGKRRNIAELQRRTAAGAIELALETEVSAIERGRVTLSSAGRQRRVDVDALFVLIGSILSTQFLEQIGLEIAHKESQS